MGPYSKAKGQNGSIFQLAKGQNGSILRRSKNEMFLMGGQGWSIWCHIKEREWLSGTVCLLVVASS